MKEIVEECTCVRHKKSLALRFFLNFFFFTNSLTPHVIASLVPESTPTSKTFTIVEGILDMAKRLDSTGMSLG
jgi:hypothetical protein